MSADPLALLNLGCGGHCHADWINLDIAASAVGVIPCDLSRGIPFPDGVFDAVYHSHLLEHLPHAAAPAFMADCFRVLKPGGVARVAVPDLEAIVRLYLKFLEGALAGDETAARRYDWMVVELLDQLVRHVPGGEMLAYWRSDPLPEAELVFSRMGAEARRAVEALKRAAKPAGNTGRKSDPAAVGAFRLSGECHQWMYDRFSLGRLLDGAGFVGVTPCAADVSRIPEFNSYLLDIEADGSVRKPDSLFMEAVKPAGGPR